LAQIEFAAQNRPVALEHFRAAADLNPEDVLSLNAAAYLMATSDADGALKLAEKALQLAPEDPKIQDTLGWIYYRKGQFSRAINYLQFAVAKQPTAAHEFHLAMTYLKSGDKGQGQELLGKALLKDPNLKKTEVGW
jgi:predicted Zn-dependent protease